MQVLVTGATGYIGGRLVPRLLEAGHSVRVFVRNPRKLQDVPWSSDVDVAEGDLQDADAVRAAVDGVEAVYYLAHAMGADGDFESAERQAAETMAHEAKRAGVSRFVYLGGLHPDGDLSKHLRSRKEVGEILLHSGVPTIAYQAGVVIGSGSTSFEMIRHVTDVLPWMPAPRWVRNRIQPIAVRDVLYYLVAALDVPADVNRTFDIGGPDVLRYGQMLNGYAVEAKLRQRPITVLPVLTPRLAAHWFNVVTPIPRKLATPIIESLQFECVQREHDIDDVVPQPEGGLTSYRRAVRLALNKMRSGEVQTSWRSATLSSASADPMPTDPDWAGHTVYVDDRKRHSTASAEDVWRVVESIGGENGWYSFPLAWVARGWMDKVAGGVGLSRGRRDQDRLEQGDALDWWRVERLERGHYLRLRAEFKSPGRAWLEMTVTPNPEGGSDYHQRAIYFPQGLPGRLYWYGILPFHGIIFPGMVERITAAAERESDNTESTQRNRTQHNGSPEPANEEAA
ncbi:SDR family oxidoreductase [Curtobacterium sp. MWU13-2055]|uniref:SDR family oxidoreductase n=1 Tax=Curtobacterium sp. MWU13-2055 TaxID=2931928 RepID=UPI002010247A|nr:SDR family oxidoreductase [Curtobacterium sp. MWU13-2055]